MTLTLIDQLIRKLNADGIAYCHWKSNTAMAETLDGTPGDLMELRESSRQAIEVLSDHPILYTIGAGTRQRAFATEVDGFLVQAPMAWDAEAGRWGPPEGTAPIPMMLGVAARRA